MLKNMSIRGKLLFNSIPQMAMIIILAIMLGVGQNNTLKESRHVYYEQIKQLSDKLMTVDRNFHKTQMAIDRLQLPGTEAYKTGNMEDYEEYHQQVLDGLEEINKMMSSDQYLYKSFRIKDQADGCDVILDRTLGDINSWDSIYDPVAGTGDYYAQASIFGDARTGIKNLEEIIDEYAKYQDQRMSSQIRKKSVVILIICFTLIAVVGISSFKIIAYIKNSVGLVADSLSHLAEGEFIIIDKYTNQNDEVGQMIRDSNNLIDKLSEIIMHLKGAVESVNASSEELADTADQISCTSDGVAEAVAGIASGALQQASDIQNANDNVTRISVAVANVMSSTNSLESTTDSMNEESKGTAQNLDELRESSEDMSMRITEIAERINATSDAVSNIGAKVAAITSIASQTNLLALNASIEAARAGEAGRGFAVVAEEISNLADESAAAAKEIMNEMKVLMEESQGAVATAEDVKITNDKQHEIITNTVNSIQTLIDAISMTVDGVLSIRGDATQSEEAKLSVVDAMNSLSAISEENAASTEETAASMEELSATIMTLAQSADGLKDVAGKLAQDISFFK